MKTKIEYPGLTNQDNEQFITTSLEEAEKKGISCLKKHFKFLDLLEKILFLLKSKISFKWFTEKTIKVGGRQGLKVGSVPSSIERLFVLIYKYILQTEII